MRLLTEKAAGSMVAIKQGLDGVVIIEHQRRMERLQQSGRDVEATCVATQTRSFFHPATFADNPPTENGQPGAPDRRGGTLSG